MTVPFLDASAVAAIWSVHDFEPLAKDRMRHEVHEFVTSWAGTGEGCRINRSAFDRWVFRPRVLRDVSTVDTSTTVLGVPVRTPVFLGASAMHRLSHPDGELATARAAKAAGGLMMLSTSTSTPPEAVAEVGPPLWMQLYWMSDREISREIVRRAEESGFGAIALTVDAPRLGWRELEFRLGDWDVQGIPQALLPDPYPPGLRVEPGLTWRSLDWLRGITKLPIVLKGVMTPEDATIAADEGIPAIIVSNHGGRQLDHAMASLDALPPIVDAVGDRMELYLDSGVRRGTDVLKAIALGARGVFLGRPVHWALATGGEPALSRMLELINGELSSAMGVCGAASIDQVERAMVAPRPA
jgi:4-hydroxymandelate oxidase